MSSKLQERSVLMRFTAGLPGQHRKDKRVTSEVKASKGLGENSGKWVKDLWPENALKAVKTLQNEARSYHDKVTFPFGSLGEDGEGATPIGGIGILPATLIKEYGDTMRDYASKLQKLVADFCAKGSDWVAWARNEHNGTFDAANYPGCDESGQLDVDKFTAVMRKKFYLHVEPLPVPDSEQFSESVSALLGVDTSSVDLRVADAGREAQRELLRRMIDPVQHMASRLAGAPCHCRDCKGKVAKSDGFKDTLVSNIAEIAGLVSKLNLGDDASLNDFALMMEALTQIPAQSIRENSKTRAIAAAEADALAKKMAAYKI